MKNQEAATDGNQVQVSKNQKKNMFKFAYFEDLKQGDVFKFSPIIDSEIPSIFFTAYYKDENTTKFDSTYGKIIYRNEFKNDIDKEIMIFINRRKRN